MERYFLLGEKEERKADQKGKKKMQRQSRKAGRKESRKNAEKIQKNAERRTVLIDLTAVRATTSISDDLLFFSLLFLLSCLPFFLPSCSAFVFFLSCYAHFQLS